MQRKLYDVLNDPELAQSLADSGLQTIRTRHTCAHRVDELLHIIEELHPTVPAWQRTAAHASFVMGAAR
jgi:spore maturation protein CgeB